MGFCMFLRNRKGKMQGKTGDVHIQRVIPVGKEDRAGRIKPCLGVIIFSLVYRVAFPVLFFYSTGRKQESGSEEWTHHYTIWCHIITIKSNP